MTAGIDVWVAPLDEPAASTEGLSAEERERAGTFLRPEVAERWIASRLALRRVLATYLDEGAATIEITIGENGKPRLERGGLEFNLSHSGDLALIAISRQRPVGVDLERVEPGRDLIGLAERALEPGDVASLREAAPERRATVFYAAWTRHEARRKCLGVGLTGDDPGTPVAVRNLEIAPGYAAALAVAGEQVGPVRCRSLRAS